MPTHDQYWEYYDSVQHIITYCASGYVMTGISKKTNPYDLEWHIEWMQCCRVGFAGGTRFATAKIAPETPRVTRSGEDQERDFDKAIQRADTKITEGLGRTANKLDNNLFGYLPAGLGNSSSKFTY
ncbi:hypothetical protein RvY_05794 [Ramazzottius varieornatus]|uniref:Uncharacterized protein n=1 Tax=Ramazzottius varieornatus TaxID=947166 RepID=A0A1D1UZA6_RAMVA|nr:hypothetical protein RvY_05794 [Ramazzottius varieornatus]